MTDDVMAEPRPRKRRKATLPRAQDAPRYEFGALVRGSEELRQYATESSTGRVQLDLSSRAATLALTRAILRDHFDLNLQLPEGQLVPTVPNRVQYLTWAANLLGLDASQRRCVVVDIGTGPSCIYVMLGARLFPNWAFVGTDTDQIAIDAACRNVENNDLRKVKVLHTAPHGKLLPLEVTSLEPDLIVCNPPFHAALPETPTPAGSRSQLVTDGGEFAFLCRLADESRHVSSVHWFTSLVGRKVDLPKIVAFLRSPRIRAPYVKTVELSQGGRTTRWAVAWSFGQESSEIKQIEDESSKWRLVFSVQPARRYANELRVDDVTGIIEAAFHVLHWTRQTKRDTAQAEGETTFYGPRDCGFVDTALQLQVTDTDETNLFIVHIKVVVRGRIDTNELQNLGLALRKSVLQILDELPSS